MPSNEKWLTLDGNRYAIVGRVQRFALDPLSAPIRTIGRQQQSDVSLASEFIFGTPIYGLGQARITDIDDPRQLRRIWDSEDMMTHWASQTTLGLLEEDSTEATNTKVIRGSVGYKGNLWGLWEYLSGGVYKVVSRKYNGGSTIWDGGGDLDQDGAQDATLKVAHDIQAPGSLLIAIASGRFKTNGIGTQTVDINIFTSSDGITWTIRGDLATLSDPPTANEDLDAGLICPVQIAGESIVARWRETTGSISLYSSTDDVTWNSELNIASGGGPKGIAAMIGTDGNMKLFLGTREGVYEIDTSPATWTASLIPLDMAPHDDNCRRMVVHQGALWVPIGVSDNEPSHMARVTATEQGYDVEYDVTKGGIFIGLAAGDGVPSDKLGPIRWMKSIQGLLFASGGGGAASRNGWVIVHTGLGWHPYRKNATANQKYEWIDVSADDDGTTRLHYATRTSSSASDTKILTLPLSNPKDGQSYKYEAGGFITRPEFDGGMPRYDAAWLKYFSAAIKLVAGDEEINIDYDIEDSGSFTDWGDITPTVSELDLAEGAGVAGKSIITKENYARGSTNTLSPFGRETGLVYDKHVPLKEGFEFLVDIPGTATGWDKGVEDVITALMKAAGPPATDATATLKAFTYPGLDSTKYVKVHNLTFKEAPDDPDNPLDMSQRVGNALVQVREKA